LRNDALSSLSRGCSIVSSFTVKTSSELVGKVLIVD
jgi:hypothetical protein